jgi:prevent-host-death family protein
MTGTAPPNQYNIHEAKTHFSRLIDRVERGAEVLIARDGRPVARLVPVRATVDGARRIGAMRGRLQLSEDFDAPLPRSLLKLFHAAAPPGRPRKKSPARRLQK